jgi:hypothetical protein
MGLKTVRVKSQHFGSEIPLMTLVFALVYSYLYYHDAFTKVFIIVLVSCTCLYVYIHLVTELVSLVLHIYMICTIEIKLVLVYIAVCTSGMKLAIVTSCKPTFEAGPAIRLSIYYGQEQPYCF